MKTVWTTKDGKELKIKDMDTSHIIHCINMLKKDKGTHIEGGIFGTEVWADEVDHSDETEEYLDVFEAELEIRKEVEKLWT